METIVKAFEKAAADGQWATHLRPLVHPDLVREGHENPILSNRETVQVEESIQVAHKLREVNALELNDDHYFGYPVIPSHALDFEIARNTGPHEKVTARMPLYLKQEGERWFVVYGILRSFEEVQRLQATESLTFREENKSYWADNWTLRFDRDSDYDYTIVVRDSSGAGEEIVLLAPSEVNLYPEEKVIRFRMRASGEEPILFGVGHIAVPYAWQAGVSGMSSSFRVDMGEGTRYEPNRNPAWEGDSLEIARLVEESTVWIVELQRSAR